MVLVLLVRLPRPPLFPARIPHLTRMSSPSRLLLRELASPATLSEPAGPPLLGEETALSRPGDDAAEADVDQLGFVTYGRARVLMTRADFIIPLDHLNVISVDVRPTLPFAPPSLPSPLLRLLTPRARFHPNLNPPPRTQINHHVRPDSHVTLNAIRSIVSEEGFDDLLDNVRDRVDEIESLHRTREVRRSPPSPGHTWIACLRLPPLADLPSALWCPSTRSCSKSRSASVVSSSPSPLSPRSRPLTPAAARPTRSAPGSPAGSTASS